MRKMSKMWWMFIGAVTVMVVALVAVLVTTGGSANRKLEKQLDLGAKYLTELEYESAIVAFEAALEIEPKSVTAYRGLAEAYVAMADYEAAIEVLHRGILETEEASLQNILEEITEKQLQVSMEGMTSAERVDYLLHLDGYTDCFQGGGTFFGNDLRTMSIGQVRDVLVEKGWISPDAEIMYAMETYHTEDDPIQEDWENSLGWVTDPFYIYQYCETSDCENDPMEVYQMGVYDTFNYWELGGEEVLPEYVKAGEKIGILDICFGDPLEEVFEKLGFTYGEQISEMVSAWREQAMQDGESFYAGISDSSEEGNGSFVSTMTYQSNGTTILYVGVGNETGTVFMYFFEPDEKLWGLTFINN